MSAPKPRRKRKRLSKADRDFKKRMKELEYMRGDFVYNMTMGRLWTMYHHSQPRGTAYR